MEGMRLDKAQVARRQLATALALFIDDLDPVSVHTLACAGGEIAESLTDYAGGQPFASHARATFPDLDLKEIRRMQRQFWNAFKHAHSRNSRLGGGRWNRAVAGYPAGSSFASDARKRAQRADIRRRTAELLDERASRLLDQGVARPETG
jgi:hypothetical protein